MTNKTTQAILVEVLGEAGFENADELADTEGVQELENWAGASKCSTGYVVANMSLSRPGTIVVGHVGHSGRNFVAYGFVAYDDIETVADVRKLRETVGEFAF